MIYVIKEINVDLKFIFYLYVRKITKKQRKSNSFE